jgi:hypothetical protein
LLAYGGVEAPLSVWTNHLWERRWVAIKLAVVIRKFVFARKMEHVDRLASILEVVVADRSLVGIQFTVVIKDEKLRRGFG